MYDLVPITLEKKIRLHFKKYIILVYLLNQGSSNDPSHDRVEPPLTNIPMLSRVKEKYYANGDPQS